MADEEMFERHLTELRVRLADTEKQAGKLRALIIQYEELMGVSSAGRAAAPDISAVAEPYPAGPEPVAVAAASRTGVRRPMVPSQLFRSTTREIMRAVGRPMLRDEIKDHLARRGIVFGGKEPVNAVSTQLYRARDEFQLVPGQGYWFADEPVPQERPQGVAAQVTPNEEGMDEEETSLNSGTATEAMKAAGGLN